MRVVAKDGAEIPAGHRRQGPARQTVGVGETFDVEVTPAEAGALVLEVRTGMGMKLGEVPVVVIPGGDDDADAPDRRGRTP